MKTFDPDDPMLTAYALGELEGDELREVEALVASDPAAARHVESIRAAAAGIGEAFEREAAPDVEPIRPIEIEPRRRSPIIPWLFYASTAAAACFFVVLALRFSSPETYSDRNARAAEAPVPEAAAGKKQAEISLPDDRGKADSVQQSKLEADALADRAANVERQDAGKAGARVNESEVRELAGARARSDAPAEQFAAPAAGALSGGASPPPPLGEMKSMAKSASAPARDEDAIVLDGFAVTAKDKAGYGTVDALQRAINAKRPLVSVDATTLLADLGFKAVLTGVESSLGNTSAQTTVDASPQPDPEAALARAVGRFARLVADHTPANDESWDRALADARYAAGDDAKRLAFVDVIEAARKIARAPDGH